MMNIIDYWKNEYAMTLNVGLNELYDMECRVFEMDDVDLVNWANAHDVDLTATVVVNGFEIPALEVWRWDFQ